MSLATLAHGVNSENQPLLSSIPTVQIILSLAVGGTLETFFTARAKAALALPPGKDTLCSEWLGEALKAAQARYALAQQDPLALLDAAGEERVYSQLPPQQRERLRNQSRFLVDTLNQRFPLAAGETLTRTQVTCLLTAWGDYEAGTVVCLQESNLGTVATLFPSLRFDRERLRLLARIDPGHIVCTKTGMPPLHPHIRPVMFTATGPSFGQAFLTFATTAAFALPNPWGVLVSGGLPVFQMFVGHSEGKNNALADTIKNALQDAVKMMRAAIKEEKIIDALACVAAEMQWVTDTFTAIKDLGDERDGASAFVKNKLDRIDEALGPENKLAFHFSEMKNIADDDKADINVRDKAFEVMITLASLHLTYMKLRVQLKSWQNLDTTDDLFYGWYDEFVTRTDGDNGYVSMVSQVFEELKQAHQQPIEARINLVGPLEHKNNIRVIPGSISDGGPTTTRLGPDYWYFVDAGMAGEHIWYDTEQKSHDCCGSEITTFIDHISEALQARQAYINTLRANLQNELAKKFSNVTAGLEQWKANAQAWSDNKPPRLPRAVPSVSSSPGDWQAATPQGPHWIKGAKVRYAVGFKNSNGGTPSGPWSEWVTVTDRAYPKLTDIPTDPLGIAKSRVIYRQFEGQEKTKVGIIPDNTATIYQDTSD